MRAVVTVVEKRAKMRRPQAVAALLEAALQGTPAGKRLREASIWLVWEQAVGAQVAARAWPAQFREGVLTVLVSSAPWMQQLSFLKGEICAKLNALLGAELVRDIFLRAGRLAAPPPAVPSAVPPRSSLTSTEQAEIASATAAIADPELRQALDRLLTRHALASPVDKS
jgi:hypothetical protein